MDPGKWSETPIKPPTTPLNSFAAMPEHVRVAAMQHQLQQQRQGEGGGGGASQGNQQTFQNNNHLQHRPRQALTAQNLSVHQKTTNDANDDDDDDDDDPFTAAQRQARRRQRQKDREDAAAAAAEIQRRQQQQQQNQHHEPMFQIRHAEPRSTTNSFLPGGGAGGTVDDGTNIILALEEHSRQQRVAAMQAHSSNSFGNINSNATNSHRPFSSDSMNLSSSFRRVEAQTEEYRTQKRMEERGGGGCGGSSGGGGRTNNNDSQNSNASGGSGRGRGGGGSSGSGARRTRSAASNNASSGAAGASGSGFVAFNSLPPPPGAGAGCNINNNNNLAAAGSRGHAPPPPAALAAKKGPTRTLFNAKKPPSNNNTTNNTDAAAAVAPPPPAPAAAAAAPALQTSNNSNSGSQAKAVTARQLLGVSHSNPTRLQQLQQQQQQQQQRSTNEMSSRNSAVVIDVENDDDAGLIMSGSTSNTNKKSSAAVTEQFFEYGTFDDVPAATTKGGGRQQPALNNNDNKDEISNIGSSSASSTIGGKKIHPFFTTGNGAPGAAAAAAAAASSAANKVPPVVCGNQKRTKREMLLAPDPHYAALETPSQRADRIIQEIRAEVPGATICDTPANPEAQKLLGMTARHWEEQQRLKRADSTHEFKFIRFVLGAFTDRIVRPLHMCSATEGDYHGHRSAAVGGGSGSDSDDGGGGGFNDGAAAADVNDPLHFEQDDLANISTTRGATFPKHHIDMLKAKQQQQQQSQSQQWRASLGSRGGSNSPQPQQQNQLSGGGNSPGAATPQQQQQQQSQSVALPPAYAKSNGIESNFSLSEKLDEPVYKNIKKDILFDGYSPSTAIDRLLIVVVKYRDEVTLVFRAEHGINFINKLHGCCTFVDFITFNAHALLMPIMSLHCRRMHKRRRDILKSQRIQELQRGISGGRQSNDDDDDADDAMFADPAPQQQQQQQQKQNVDFCCIPTQYERRRSWNDVRYIAKLVMCEAHGGDSIAEFQTLTHGLLLRYDECFKREQKLKEDLYSGRVDPAAMSSSSSMDEALRKNAPFLGHKRLTPELQTKLTEHRADTVAGAMLRLSVLEEVFDALCHYMQCEGMEKQFFSRFEKQLPVIVAKMKYVGVPIDTSQLVQLDQRMRRELAELTRQIRSYVPAECSKFCAAAPFNPDSSQDVAALLYDVLKLDRFLGQNNFHADGNNDVIRGNNRTGKGKLSTNKTTLGKLIPHHPVVSLIIRYRSVRHTRSTYFMGTFRSSKPIDGWMQQDIYTQAFDEAVTGGGGNSSSSSSSMSSNNNNFNSLSGSNATINLLDRRAVLKRAERKWGARPLDERPNTNPLRVIHPNFLIDGTETGRFSCTEPNLQNLPRVREEDFPSLQPQPLPPGSGALCAAATALAAGGQHQQQQQQQQEKNKDDEEKSLDEADHSNDVRRAIVPLRPDHVIVAFDYEQLELRVLANLSCDSGLISSLNDPDPSRRDIHRRIAASVFSKRFEQVTSDERSRCKQVVFGVLYGMSAKTLAEKIGKPETDAANLMARFNKAFPMVYLYKERIRREAKTDLWVRTQYQRRRPCPGINSGVQRERAEAERKAFNTVIQGSAADHVRYAMCEVDQHYLSKLEGSRRGEVFLLMQVHDELVFSIQRDRLAEHASAIRRHMERMPMRGMSVGFPVKVSMGPSLGRLVPIETLSLSSSAAHSADSSAMSSALLRSPKNPPGHQDFF